MANYISVIKDLERGMELCALCGKDITGAPDCIHVSRYRTAPDETKRADHEVFTPEGKYKTLSRTTGSFRWLGTIDYNMRIGMEMLLDIPYLKSLPICDPLM